MSSNISTVFPESSISQLKEFNFDMRISNLETSGQLKRYTEGLKNEATLRHCSGFGVCFGLARIKS